MGGGLTVEAGRVGAALVHVVAKAESMGDLGPSVLEVVVEGAQGVVAVDVVDVDGQDLRVDDAREDGQEPELEPGERRRQAAHEGVVEERQVVHHVVADQDRTLGPQRRLALVEVPLQVADVVAPAGARRERDRQLDRVDEIQKVAAAEGFEDDAEARLLLDRGFTGADPDPAFLTKKKGSMIRKCSTA